MQIIHLYSFLFSLFWELALFTWCRSNKIEPQNHRIYYQSRIDHKVPVLKNSTFIHYSIYIYIYCQHKLRYNLPEACEIPFHLTDCQEFEGGEVLLTVHWLPNTLLHFSVNKLFSSTQNDHYCTVQYLCCNSRAGRMMRP